MRFREKQKEKSFRSKILHIAFFIFFSPPGPGPGPEGHEGLARPFRARPGLARRAEALRAGIEIVVEIAARARRHNVRGRDMQLHSRIEDQQNKK